MSDGRLGSDSTSGLFRRLGWGAAALTIVGAAVVAGPAPLAAHGGHGHDDQHHVHDDQPQLAVVEAALGGSGAIVPAPPATIPYDQTFLLNSRPGSEKVIHLDFDGYTSPENLDSSRADQLAGVTYAPYDLDGDPTSWSNAELDVVQEVWRWVAEAFAPWDINVTTEEQTDDDIFRDGSGSDSRWGARSLITSSPSGGLLDVSPGALGLGWIGVFGSEGSSIDFSTPSSVVSTRSLEAGYPNEEAAADVQVIALTVMHEVSHNLGLDHDLVTDFQTTNADPRISPLMAPLLVRRPLMPFTPFSRNGQTVDGFPTRGANPIVDDHGDDAGSATPLLTPAVDEAGVIGFGGFADPDPDADWFHFEVGAGGALDIDVTPSPYSVMLDIDAVLIDASGSEVARSNPPVVKISDSEAAGLGAAFEELALSPGKYWLGIRGGQPGPDYTADGSIGSYSIQGNITSLVAPGAGPELSTIPSELKSVAGCSESRIICVTLTGTLLNDRNGSSHKAWFHRDGDPAELTVMGEIPASGSLECTATGGNGTLEVTGEQAGKVGGGLFSIAGKSVRFLCEGFGTSFEVRSNAAAVGGATLIATRPIIVAGEGINEDGQSVEVSIEGTAVTGGSGTADQAFSVAEGSPAVFTVDAVDTSRGAVFCDADEGIDNGQLKIRGNADRAGKRGGGLFTQTAGAGNLRCFARNGPAAGAVFTLSGSGPLAQAPFKLPG